MGGLEWPAASFLRHNLRDNCVGITWLLGSHTFVCFPRYPRSPPCSNANYLEGRLWGIIYVITALALLGYSGHILVHAPRDSSFAALLQHELFRRNGNMIGHKKASYPRGFSTLSYRLNHHQILMRFSGARYRALSLSTPKVVYQSSILRTTPLARN